MKYLTFFGRNSLLLSSRISPKLQNTAAFSSKSVADTLKSRKDFEELFLNTNVRSILKRLTGYDPSRVFASKSLDNLKSPKYRFMTDEQLQMEIENADHRAEQMLQMPPVKYSTTSEPRILEQDSAIKGYMENKMIFVDASPGYSDRERLIVVREVDGTLREATREERHRMNQVFYPVEERHMELPKMLEDENMKQVLERGAYKLLLENACLHYEPEDERYMDVCHRVYDHISEKNAFDSLYSTRYYGGMVYYYTFFRRADALLMHLLEADKLYDAQHLIELFYIVNPRAGAPVDAVESQQMTMTELAKISRENRLSIPMDRFTGLLKFYIDNDATSPQIKGKLELAAQKLQSMDRVQKAQ